MRHLLFSVVLTLSAMTQALADPTAEALLFQMQRGYHHNNFELSMVHILQNKIDPIRLTHGWSGKTEITHVLNMSGPPVEYLAKNRTVTFAETSQGSYTLQNSHLPGLFFALLDASAEHLQANYDVVVTNRNRVAGQIAQAIRLTPKHDGKYGFTLWLEHETGILLRLDIVDMSGNLVEQYLGVNFNLLPEQSGQIKELATLTVPAATQVEDVYSSETPHHEWALGWLPDGLTVVSNDRHKPVGSEQVVDYFLLSDGLVNVSVYIADNELRQKSREREQLAMHGATTILNSSRDDGLVVTLVGELPATTLRHIAETIHKTQKGDSP